MSRWDIAYQPRATLWDTCPAYGRVLKERRLSTEWQACARSPRLRRSFRTHEGGRTETQGVALGWYASPLQGDSKCPNSRSSIQGETGAACGVHSHNPFDARRGSRKAGRTGERCTTPHSGHARQGRGKASLSTWPATTHRIETGAKCSGEKVWSFPQAGCYEQNVSDNWEI
jgi:hypothetical protein